MLSESEKEAVEREIFGPPKKQYVCFYNHARKNVQASNAAGYPVFDVVPYIRIQNEGSKDARSRLATREDQFEHRREWEAFQEALSKRENKTPIGVLPGHDEATIATFREMEIFSVEDLLARSSIPAPLQHFMDSAKRWRQLAKPRYRMVDGKLEQAA